MSLEDRVRSSVDTALEDLRARVEAEMHALVDQLVAVASQERDEALQAARRDAFDEAWQTAQRDAAEATARTRALVDQQIAEARAEERAAAVRRIDEATAAAEARVAQAQRQTEIEVAIAANAARADAERLARDLDKAHSRLLEGVRGLDGATTLSEVFDALALAVGREAPRSAVLVARQDRLLGWKLAGFGARDTQPKSIEIGLTDQGVVGRAVGQARACVVQPGDPATAAPPFADVNGDVDGLSVPLIVGGRVVAVVYADRGSEPGAAAPLKGWRDVVEILARHAARCLEALTVQRTPVSAAPPRFWVAGAGAGARTEVHGEASAAPPSLAVPSGTPA